jgi:hypothetical protein
LHALTGGDQTAILIVVGAFDTASKTLAALLVVFPLCCGVRLLRQMLDARSQQLLQHEWAAVDRNQVDGNQEAAPTTRQAGAKKSKAHRIKASEQGDACSLGVGVAEPRAPRRSSKRSGNR